MNTQTADSFAVYLPKATSPNFLGEIVFITTVSQGHQVIEAESFVLIERATIPLSYSSFHIKPRSVPELNLKLDAAFIERVVLDVCKAAVAKELQAKFAKSQNWAMFETPFEYEQTDKSYLVQRWLLGCWEKELKNIRDTTRYSALAQFIDEITMLRPVSWIARPDATT